MIREFKLQNETLKFRMTNRTIFIIDEKYENFGDVINGLMYGSKLYNNALKVIECSCISKRKEDKELSFDELQEKLTSNQITKEIVPFATQLYLDYMGVKEESKEEGKEKESKKK